MSDITDATEKVKQGDADREARWAERADDERDLRESISEGMRSLKAEAESEQDFEQSRDLRKEVRDRFGGRPLGEIVNTFAQAEHTLAVNPKAGFQMLADHYTAEPPLREKKKPQPEWWEGDPGEEVGAHNDVRRAMKALRQDHEDSTSTADARAKLKGRSFSEALGILADADARLRQDPVGEAARLAGQSLPAHRHMQAKADLTAGLERVAAANVLPGFDSMRDEIADVIDEMNAKGWRSGDNARDLQAAYDEAMHRRKVADAKKARAAKGKAPIRPGSNTSHDDVKAALAEMRGRRSR